MSDDIVLVIGSKRYSSWSMRPWVALTEAKIPFREELIPFAAADWQARVAARSPSRKVPCLEHGALKIWESLAICEYAAERAPDAHLWPEARAARAIARAASCEMHAGFGALRSECPMNVALRATSFAPSPAVLRDLDRLFAVWRACRAAKTAEGSLLFGHFTIADAMFAPVVTRIRSYALPVPPDARAYCDAVEALPSMRAWCAAGALEPEEFVPVK